MNSSPMQGLLCFTSTQYPTGKQAGVSSAQHRGEQVFLTGIFSP